MEWFYAVLGFAVIATQFVILFNVQRQHAAERADMLDRLMSRNITEYKEVTTPVQASEPVARSDEDEWAMEVEQSRR